MMVSSFSGPGSLLWTYLTPSVSVYLYLSFYLSDDGEFVQWARFSSVDFLDFLCLCLSDDGELVQWTRFSPVGFLNCLSLSNLCLCLSVCMPAYLSVS